MKIKPTMLKLLILLSCTFATTAVFGQSPLIYTWTNQFPGHLAVNSGDMNQATNWNPNGVPTPMTPTPDANGNYGDLMLFDGQTTGPLSVTEDGGTLAGGGGQSYPAGARIELTTNQTASVTIYSVVGLSGGLRMNSFNLDPGSGGLILGDHSGHGFDFLCGEQNGQIFGFTNNSTVTAVINETVSFRCGGAGSHPMVFAGTGDWIVNNHMRSHNSSALQVMMEGSGTFTWTGTNSGTESAVWYDKSGNPVRFDSGTTILKSSDLLNADNNSPNIVNNGTLLKFDYTPAPGIITTPDSIFGNISGTGPIQVNAGTTTFAGASTFTGNINLTGGELIAGSAENVGVSGPLGQDGIISFNGGTLGWNLANAYDYSSRFDTTAGQVYNLDTGASNPTLATGLTSSGGTLTKTGGGALTLAGINTYSGLTTVSAGTLVLAGKSGNGNINVADNAGIGVVENGTPFTPNTLTLGTLNGVTFEGNNVTNKIAAPMQPVNLASTGPTTVNVNSGRFRLIGDTFPLLAWSSGTPPGTSLNFLAGAGGHLVTNVNNKEIDLVIDLPPYIWTGAASGSWVAGGPINWIYSGSPASWANGNFALFDDSLTANPSVTISGIITGQLVTFDNGTTSYTLNSPDASDNLGGSTSLTMAGSGTLTLSGGGHNTYTGITTVGGGIVDVTVLANGGTASDIGAATSGNTNIVLSGGGTLQYNGPGVSIDRLFSVGQNGGTIDNEGGSALVFNNPGPLGMSGNGPRTLTLAGPQIGNTLNCAIVNHPAGTSLAMNGTGTWILTGTNTYASGTVVNNGILQIGAGDAKATIGNGDILTLTGTTIDFERTGTLLVPGSISGGGAVTSGTDGTATTNGTVILANNNNYTAGTTINAGTLQVGNGGGSGSLNGIGLIAVNNNSTLAFNTSGSFVYGSGANGVISGTGNVSVRGGGFIKAIGANTYTGWTFIDANTTFQPLEGQDGGLVSSVVTNNGALRLVRQDATITYPGPIVGTGKLQIAANNINIGTITLTGSNTFTGGIYIGGNTLILGDGSTVGAGAIPNNSLVVFTNNSAYGYGVDNPRTLEFNRPVGDDFTFSGNIVTNSSLANAGIVQLQGGDTITLTGNNTYGGGTIVNAGQVIIGNGGATGSVGPGPVTLASGTPLVINRTGNLAIPGDVSGSGGVTLINSGTVTLSSTNNTYTGDTTISNGTLVVTSLGGNLNVEGGTVVVQGIASAANLTVPGNMNIDSGTVVATLDPALSPSNTTYTVGGGTINYTGGTLKLLTAGHALATGEYFKIFSGPVTGGAAMPIFSPGCTVSNGLAVDGSVTVLTAQPLLPTTFSFSVLSRTNLVLSWATAWAGGVHVQSQTDALTNGLGANPWVTISGSDASSSYTNVINKAVGSMFFRLIIP